MRRLLLIAVLFLAGCEMMEPMSPEARMDQRLRQQQYQLDQQQRTLDDMEHRQRMEDMNRRSEEFHRDLDRIWRKPSY